MLIPRRVKHRKQHHPDRSGAAKGGTELTFGTFGIQADRKSTRLNSSHSSPSRMPSSA